MFDMKSDQKVPSFKAAYHILKKISIPSILE